MIRLFHLSVNLFCIVAIKVLFMMILYKVDPTYAMAYLGLNVIEYISDFLYKEQLLKELQNKEKQ